MDVFSLGWLQVNDIIIVQTFTLQLQSRLYKIYIQVMEGHRKSVKRRSFTQIQAFYSFLLKAIHSVLEKQPKTNIYSCPYLLKLSVGLWYTNLPPSFPAVVGTIIFCHPKSYLSKALEWTFGHFKLCRFQCLARSCESSQFQGSPWQTQDIYTN